MKYPQLVSMPSEVSDWLEEQLEARGIDAVVYTRYILSLLHRDSADQDLQITQPNKVVLIFIFAVMFFSKLLCSYFHFFYNVYYLCM